MKITGVVLAGGKSSRFGYNKAEVIYQGETLLQRAIDLLQPYCDSVWISGEQQLYGAYQLPVIPDAYISCGPLGGIASTMVLSKTEYLLYLTCDMPLLSSDIIHQILDKERSIKYQSWKENDEETQPFPLLISKSLLPLIMKQLEEGLFSIKALGRVIPEDQKNFLEVGLDLQFQFMNMNTLVDYYKLNK